MKVMCFNKSKFSIFTIPLLITNNQTKLDLTVPLLTIGRTLLFLSYLEYAQTSILIRMQCFLNCVRSWPIAASL